MLSDAKAFSGFSVDDTEAAKQFYGETLGVTVTVTDEQFGLLTLELGGGTNVLVYGKDDHAPATYTVLNFPVADIDATVDALAAKGVTFERYDGMQADEKGIHRGMGPDIAWFKDPAGNILSVMKES